MKSNSSLHLLAACLLANLSYALQGRIALTRMPTSLNYKEEFIVVHHSQSTEQQESVDVYLEFLHKRYNQINEETNQIESRSGRDFPFRRFLQDENAEDFSNALEALGLSNLASQKLLQKFHMTASSPPIESEMLSILSKAIGAIVLARQRFIALYEAKLRSISSALLRAMRATPYTLKRIVGLGGGKTSLVLSMSVAYVLLFSVVRPLSQTPFKNALQQVTRA